MTIQNYKILHKNGGTSTTLNNKDVVLVPVFKNENELISDMKNKTLSINLSNNVSNVCINVFQIAYYESYTYSDIQNKIVRGINNIYLDKKIVTATNESERKVTFNINNLYFNNSNQAMIAIYFNSIDQTEFSTSIDVNVFSDQNIKSPIGENIQVSSLFNHSYNSSSRSFSYMDTIYVYQDSQKKKTFPFNVGCNSTNGTFFKKYGYYTDVNLNTSLNFYVEKDSNGLTLYNYTGDKEYYKDMSNVNEDVINKLNEIEYELKTKHKQEIYEDLEKNNVQNSTEIYNNIDNYVDAKLYYCKENGTYLCEVYYKFEYDQTEGNFEPQIAYENFSYIMLDRTSTMYEFSTIKKSSPYALYLDRITYPDNETVTFIYENHIANGQIYEKTLTRIEEFNIDITYDVDQSGQEYNRYTYKTIDFKNDYRRIEFQKEFDDENYKSLYFYKLVDYSDDENNVILKHVKITYESNEVTITCIEDLLDNKKLELTYYFGSSTYLTGVKSFLNGRTNPFENITFYTFDDYIVIKDNYTNEEVYYIKNNDKLISDIIYNKQSKISFEYDNGNIKKKSVSLIEEDEIDNNNFIRGLETWEHSNAQVVRKENINNTNFLELKENTSIQKNLDLISGTRYKIKGKIKNIEPGDLARIYISGSYDLSNSTSSGIGGPSLDMTLETYDFDLEYCCESDTNLWYEFETENLIIPMNAQNINATLYIETINKLLISELEVINTSSNQNILNSKNIVDKIDEWSYDEHEKIQIIDNDVLYIKLNQNGKLFKNVNVNPSESYLFRGIIKKINPNINSTSKASVVVTYYEANQENGVIDTQQKTIETHTTLNQLVGNYYEFMCSEITIPYNAIDIECCIKLEADEIMLIKEVNLTKCSFNSSNLNEIRRLPNGMNDLTQDNHEILKKYVVSSLNDFEIVQEENTFDFPSAYGNKVLKIKGNKILNDTTKTLSKQINLFGKKNETIELKFLTKTFENNNTTLKVKLTLYGTSKKQFVEEFVNFSTIKYHEFSSYIKALDDFYKVEVVFEYNGENDLFLTDINIRKKETQSIISYDEFGLPTSDDNNFIVYNNKDCVVATINKDEVTKYEYNSNNLKTSKIIDSQGNSITYDYYGDNDVRKITTSVPACLDLTNMEENYTYNVREKTYYDPFNKFTIYRYDYLNRLEELTLPNYLNLGYTYNKQNQMKKMETYFLIDNQKNEIEYDEKGNIIKVVQNNGITYTFTYTNQGLLEEVYREDCGTGKTLIEKNTYNNLEMITEKETITEKIYYIYDNKRKLVQVKSLSKDNGLANETIQVLCDIIYDKNDYIMLVKDYIDDHIIHYTYDDQGHLIRKSFVNEDNCLEYVFDDKGALIEKKSLSENKKINYDLVNSKTNSEYIYDIVDEFDADVVLGADVKSSLFGMFAKEENEYVTQYDFQSKILTTQLRTKADDITYDLDNWNNYRQSRYKNKKLRTKATLKSEFNLNKTFSIWLKPEVLNNYSSIIKLYNNNESQIGKLKIKDNGKLSFMIDNNEILVSSNKLIVNEWNLISLSILSNTTSNTIKYHLCLNGINHTMLTTLYIHNINTLKFEDSLNIERLTKYDIGLIFIDGFNHTSETLQNLYSNGIKYFTEYEPKYMSTTINVDDNIHNYKKYIDDASRTNKEEYVIDDQIIYSNEFKYNKTRVIETQQPNGIKTTYDYDNMGNIIQKKLYVNNQIDKTYTYTYDKLGRLNKEIQCFEDLTKSQTSIDYTYDIDGNILEKTKTNVITHQDNTEQQAVEEMKFTYDSNCKDKLTSCNKDDTDIDIVYSSNKYYPSKINNVSLTWNKGKLISYGNNTYEYNILGQRIKKTTQTHIHEYTYDDNLLVKEKITNKSNNQVVVLEYIYDQQNILIGVVENNNVYYYDRDITGEIRGLIDTNGNYVIKYYYTAFGEVTKEPILANNIINLNPFLYKGYYYDEETQLYWVSSRYYSPELCRWISPDSIEYLDPQSINGLNLYAYCGNDPINKYDPTGHFAITLTTLLIGGLIAGAIGAGIGLGTAVYKDVKEDGVWFNGDWTDYVGRTLGGFVAGFGVGICTVLGAGVGAAALGGTTATLFTSTGLTLSLGSALGIGSGVAFATGMAGYAVRTGISRSEDFKVQNMFIEGGFNAVSGALSVLGGYLGSMAGVHNTVFTKLLSQKGDFWLRLLVENVFTAGFKLTNALIKPYFMI